MIATRFPADFFAPAVLATRLADLRREAGFTLDTLAERCGIARSYLIKLERGLPGNPGIVMICTLAEALGVSPLYLLGWDVASIFGGSSIIHAELNNEAITRRACPSCHVPKGAPCVGRTGNTYAASQYVHAARFRDPLHHCTGRHADRDGPASSLLSLHGDHNA